MHEHVMGQLPEWYTGAFLGCLTAWTKHAWHERRNPGLHARLDARAWWANYEKHARFACSFALLVWSAPKHFIKSNSSFCAYMSSNDWAAWAWVVELRKGDTTPPPHSDNAKCCYHNTHGPSTKTKLFSCFQWKRTGPTIGSSTDATLREGLVLQVWWRLLGKHLRLCYIWRFCYI